jgi:hypothetical protein
MKQRLQLAALVACLAVVPSIQTARAEDGPGQGSVVASPASLTFNTTWNGPAPPAQTLSVTAPSRTRFSVSASVQTERSWLQVAPSGSLTTNQKLTITVAPGGLARGTYHGAITLASSGNSLTVPVTLNIVRSSGGGAGLTLSPSSLTFSAVLNGANPIAQALSVTATSATNFTASASVQSGGNWLSISPSGSLTTNQNLSVSARIAGLAAGTYTGAVSVTSNGTTRTAQVTLVVNTTTGGGGGGGTSTGFKLIGWNDLGMHCFDGKDYSVFAVLPPYNTIHVHLLDSTGKLVNAPAGYTLTYQAINDPLTNTMNTTSAPKSNFWQYAQALGFGALAPDVGLKGYAMPGSGNTPRALTFNAPDNTWMAEGIPMMPYADAAGPPYPTNYFPMMRVMAKNSSGTVVAQTDIVLPVSDEMTCNVCHSSSGGTLAARPSNGWVNNPDPAKDVKLNMLRKHDDRFATTSLFRTAATVTGYNTAGLEATVATKPILCDSCHGSNALSLPGVSGVPTLTVSMHGLHAGVVDPATNQTMESGTARETCYRCHPGPATECLRGAMGTLKTSTGANAVECQSCHGPMSSMAAATRKGWLDMPNCQSCHTGTATKNSGQIVYTSVFSSGTTVRAAADQTFATNPNTPMSGVSLYRYSQGHGGLQCEACHGSTHAEYATPIVNDNVQSTNLQGHAGTLAECTACHSTVPTTTNGGPHGLHPIGSTWVSGHQSAAEGNRASCQPCHGTDYRGTILSKVQADRTLAGRSFAKGTIIGCYSCHNGPNGG